MSDKQNYMLRPPLLSVHIQLNESELSLLIDGITGRIAYYRSSRIQSVTVSELEALRNRLERIKGKLE